MAKPVAYVKGTYHQGLGSIGIAVDPILKDEITMRKFWIMKLRKFRVDTRLGTLLRGLRT